MLLFKHENKTIYFFIVIILLYIIMSIYWQWGSIIPDSDAYYHVAVPQIIYEQGIITDFPWQQYSILKDNYTDHHLLYHILLIPFVNFINPLFGIKLSSIIFSVLFFITLYIIYKKLKLHGSELAILLLILTPLFTFRLNLIKANSLSLIILFLGIYLAHQKKYKLLFLISFLYVWVYGGFIILLGSVGLLALYDLLLTKKIKHNLILVTSCLTGLISGLIINPYFPKNIYFYWNQIFEIGIINYQNQVVVGSEWLPLNAIALISTAVFVCILTIFSLLLFIKFLKKQNKLSLLAASLTFVSLYMMLKSQRYVEYFVPFAVLFIITQYNIVFPYIDIYKKIILNFYKKYFVYKIIFSVFIVFIVITIPMIVRRDFTKNNENLKKGEEFTKYSQASTWLYNNSVSGDIVFHNTWDDFPILFMNNQKNYYLIGLDPTFMYKYNSDLYKKWESIISGITKNELEYTIKNDFKAKYVFIEQNQDLVISNLDEYTNFKKVYLDNEAIIYQTY